MDLSFIYKLLLILFCSVLVPLSAVCFVTIRRSRKQEEFSRTIDVLGIAPEEAEFANNRVSEHYSGRDYVAPVALVWLLSVLGFYGLFFGADMVSEHRAKINFVLTGVLQLSPDEMQHLRVQSMVVMVWGYLGAFMWACLHVSRRMISGDLAPSAYVNAAIRLILAPILALAISFLSVATPDVVEGGEAMLPVIAFLVGFFPDEALIYLYQRVPIFAARSKHSAHQLSLGTIEGINVFDRARLGELEINDAQNLATADLVEILVRTPFSPGKVIDWIGQAQLFMYFKDDVVNLRKFQVRSIFDLVAIGGDERSLSVLAEQSGIALFGLQLASTQAESNPRIRQLNHFKNRLCCLHDAAEQRPALRPIEPDHPAARRIDSFPVQA